MRKDQLKVLYLITSLSFVFATVAAFYFPPNNFRTPVTSVLSGLFASLLAVTLVSRYAESTRLGIRTFFKRWLPERPEDEIEQLFRNAKTVEICAVTFWNTLFHKTWFAGALKKRLQSNSKITQILLLKPNSKELDRRDKQGRPQEKRSTLKVRNGQAASAIEKVLDDLGFDEPNIRREHLRCFDYAPVVNWLRADSIAFVVLLTHGGAGNHSGGYSPALELEEHSPLFTAYESNFRGMWKEAEDWPAVKTKPTGPGSVPERPNSETQNDCGLHRDTKG